MSRYDNCQQCDKPLDKPTCVAAVAFCDKECKWAFDPCRPVSQYATFCQCHCKHEPCLKSEIHWNFTEGASFDVICEKCFSWSTVQVDFSNLTWRKER